MTNKLVKGLLASGLSFGLVLCGGNVASAATGSVPKEVLEKANAKVQFEAPQPVKAWETDINGNVIKEVVPLSQRSSTLVPNDGFQYVFDTYVSSSPSLNWYYKNIGTMRYANHSSSKGNAQYSQTSTTTSNWSVSTNLNVKGEIGLSFLSKLEVSLGGSYAYSKTYSQGVTYGASQEVPPNSIYYLTAYSVAGKDSGSLRYKKYSPGGGSWMGYYYETASGSAVSNQHVNIDVTQGTSLR